MENSDTEMVLKSIHLNERRNFGEYTFSQVSAEAVSMLATSSSTRTIDIYGHCASSVLVERGFYIYDNIIPKGFFMDRETFDRKYGGDQLSHNSLSPESKLKASLAMAEGIAELHGNAKSVIVNDDVVVDQWLALVDQHVGIVGVD